MRALDWLVFGAGGVADGLALWVLFCALVAVFALVGHGLKSVRRKRVRTVLLRNGRIVVRAA